jgi:hypothetical protein
MDPDNAISIVLLAGLVVGGLLAVAWWAVAAWCVWREAREP